MLTFCIVLFSFIFFVALDNLMSVKNFQRWIEEPFWEDLYGGSRDIEWQLFMLFVFYSIGLCFEGGLLGNKKLIQLVICAKKDAELL